MVNLEGAEELGMHANFQSFGTAFLTLIRCATGEAWNQIMFDSSRTSTIDFECVQGESY